MVCKITLLVNPVRELMEAPDLDGGRQHDGLRKFPLRDPEIDGGFSKGGEVAHLRDTKQLLAVGHVRAPLVLLKTLG